MTDKSEPAFPVSNAANFQCPGLTKREWFAGMALQGLLAGEVRGSAEDFAVYAYSLADRLQGVER